MARLGLMLGAMFNDLNLWLQVSFAFGVLCKMNTIKINSLTKSLELVKQLRASALFYHFSFNGLLLGFLVLHLCCCFIPHGEMHLHFSSFIHY